MSKTTTGSLKSRGWVLESDPDTQEGEVVQIDEDGQVRILNQVAIDKDFQHRHGRRYHGEEANAYLLPNDDAEQSRLNTQHEVIKLALDGSLSWVDINPDVKSILDVGCGTGVWSIEMAQAHPDIQVVGVDISTIQPETKPKNCTFIKADAEKDWKFDTKFDFIHARLLTFGLHDWKRFFKQCFENLEPGGWLENLEFVLPVKRCDNEEQKQSDFIDFTELWADCMLKVGLNPRISDTFTRLLEDQGFSNIERVDMQFPTSPWPRGDKFKAMGKKMMINTIEAHKSYAGTVSRVTGFSDDEVEAMRKASVTDVVTQGHYYCPIVYHRAQKPS